MLSEYPGKANIMNSQKISIIMPVLNEAKSLRNTIAQLQLSDTEELIVVDGGSSDNTISIAREFTDKVYESETGRAHVMNYGAAKADGEILLFLHADCVLPDKGFDMIRESISKNKITAGGFYLGINHPEFRFRAIEFGANMRSFLFSYIYGDQGIFLKKKTFESVGGYAEIPLMEDIDLSIKLKKLGKIVFLKPPIQSSPRRWLEEGALYTTLRDWTIAFSYRFLNASPGQLIKHYKDIR